MSVEKDSHHPAYHDEDTDDYALDEEKQKNLQQSASADDPFGNEEEGEVKYRVMNWW